VLVVVVEEERVEVPSEDVLVQGLALNLTNNRVLEQLVLLVAVYRLQDAYFERRHVFEYLFHRQIFQLFQLLLKT